MPFVLCFRPVLSGATKDSVLGTSRFTIVLLLFLESPQAPEDDSQQR